MNSFTFSSSDLKTARMPAWWQRLGADAINRLVWHATLFVAALTGLVAAGPQGLAPVIIMQLMFTMTATCMQSAPERAKFLRLTTVMFFLTFIAAAVTFIAALLVLPVWVAFLLPVSVIINYNASPWATRIFQQETLARAARVIALMESQSGK